MSATLLTSLASASAPPDEVAMRQALVVDRVASSGRVLLFTDAVEALRAAGGWRTPIAGATLPMPDGASREWNQVATADDGWLALRGGAYAVWRVESDEERVMILDAAGHSSVLVNAEPRTGDPYENGYVKLPVLLKKGENEFIFKAGRGRVRAKLVAPAAELYVSNEDATLPDLLTDEYGQYGAVLVVNASQQPLNAVEIATRIAGADEAIHLDLKPDTPDMVIDSHAPISIPALSTRKIPMRFGKVPSRAAGAAEGKAFEPFDIAVSLTLTATRGDQKTPLSLTHELKMPVRSPAGTHKRTFISRIDGSVQYYSVVPATSIDESHPPALVLSLHGASVEATSQAGAYAQKDWCHIVCATNRRPFGFDWEDWGRADAIEVLNHARSDLFPVDDRRVYLTGHSMGGHGTWQIGAHFPASFAAIAPSAGWSTFGSYGGGPPNVYENGTAPQQLLRRASSPSDTLALAKNYAMLGVYILHGDADDNVPVTQARAMKKLLADFHTDFAYYERPGAGHWWGNECVDWPPLFEFLKRHALIDGPIRRSPIDERRKRIEFVTASPSVSSNCDWVTILQQREPLKPSRIDITCDPAKKRYTAATDNVESFMIEFDALLSPSDTFAVEVDGTLLDGISFPLPSKEFQGTVTLRREHDTWTSASGYARLNAKHPGRGGLFKNAFANTVVLVYGTKGTAQENAWALAKAKFDAESFWYRGNGSIEVMSDAQYASDPDRRGRTSEGQSTFPGRTHCNVVLYGNRDTNAAWPILLSDSPIQVSRDALTVGDRTLQAENLAALFIRPMPDHEYASVGVVAGTGLPGCRLTDKLPVFVSGVGIPDWVVLSTDMFRDADRGLIGAGFFGNDWSLVHGESAWLDPSAK